MLDSLRGGSGQGYLDTYTTGPRIYMSQAASQSSPPRFSVHHQSPVRPRMREPTASRGPMTSARPRSEGPQPGLKRPRGAPWGRRNGQGRVSAARNTKPGSHSSRPGGLPNPSGLPPSARQQGARGQGQGSAPQRPQPRAPRGIEGGTSPRDDGDPSTHPLLAPRPSRMQRGV